MIKNIKTAARVFFISLLSVGALIWVSHSKCWASETIKVGIFQNKPIVYFEDKPKGLFVEILDHVAEKESWNLEYVECELKDCVTLLESNKLDLMTSFGQSPERLETLFFSKESIWTFWGTVYSKDINIHGVLDLNDKKIAVRKKNIVTSSLQKLLTDFNISAKYMEFDNYEAAFKAFQDGLVDAVAVNNTYGFDKQKEISLYRTPIVFSPFSTYFAAPRNGRHKDKLAVIDGYVEELKRDRTSLIYAFERKWFGSSPTYWTGKRIGIISVIVFFVIVCVMSFWRYRSIVEINKKLIQNIEKRKLAEEKLKKTTNDLGKRLKELNCLYRISGLVDKENTTIEEIFQGIVDLIPPSWQHPEITCGQIKIGGQSFRSDNFKETEWLQSQRIMVSETKVGAIEVYYLEEKPEIDEGPFLKEERDLIDAIAEGIGKIIKNKQAEDEKTSLENRLGQAQKMEAIGTLAGGIAHDFNNVLAVILGYSALAQAHAPPGTKYQEDLDKVLVAANRAKDLVKQILSFSRQAQVDRMPMKIQLLIKEGLKMLRSSIPATIRITEDIDPNSETVLADPTQIHQILMNLGTNAYHAMETTGGELAVTLKTTFIDTDDQTMLLHVSPGEYVELTVTDTGNGIGPDVIEKIFDPYYTTKEIGKGTGMGLAIVYGIMKEYGGEITVESQLGKGTTFHVYFPVIQKDAIPEIQESEDFPKGNERILFIDDEELLAEMGKDMLEKLGYYVTVRRSSIEALATFQNTPQEFDMVITDQTMPDMTGADLAQRMMQIRPDIPIILCTGYSNLVDEDSAKGLGIKEFALKPYTIGDISKLIRKVLDSK